MHIFKCTYFSNRRTGRPAADLSEQRRLAAFEVQALNFLKVYSANKTAVVGLTNGVKDDTATGTTAQQHPQQQASFDDRFTKIFVRLFALRSLDSATIEQLFFANLIGQVQIDNVIPYILKLGGAGVSIHLTHFFAQQ